MLRDRIFCTTHIAGCAINHVQVDGRNWHSTSHIGTDKFSMNPRTDGTFSRPPLLNGRKISASSNTGDSSAKLPSSHFVHALVKLLLRIGPKPRRAQGGVSAVQGFARAQGVVSAAQGFAQAVLCRSKTSAGARRRKRGARFRASGSVLLSLPLAFLCASVQNLDGCKAS